MVNDKKNLYSNWSFDVVLRLYEAFSVSANKIQQSLLYYFDIDSIFALAKELGEKVSGIKGEFKVKRI